MRYAYKEGGRGGARTHKVLGEPPDSRSGAYTNSATRPLSVIPVRGCGIGRGNGCPLSYRLPRPSRPSHAAKLLNFIIYLLSTAPMTSVQVASCNYVFLGLPARSSKIGFVCDLSAFRWASGTSIRNAISCSFHLAGSVLVSV